MSDVGSGPAPGVVEAVKRLTMTVVPGGTTPAGTWTPAAPVGTTTTTPDAPMTTEVESGFGGGGGGGAAGGFAVTDPDPPPQPISHDNAKAVIAIDLVNLVTESPWYSIARHARIPHLRAPLKASRGIPVKSARCRVSLASSRS